LAGVLESRVKHVEEYLKLSADDPKRFLDTMGDTVLTGPVLISWDDIRRGLLNLPREQLSSRDMAGYMDLLESAVQISNPMEPDKVQALYVLYRTKGLEQRAAALRRKYAKDAPSFDEFDAHHPELKQAVKD
jgi:hypothetical protein